MVESARAPVIVAAAVIERQGRVLLTQRLPHGHLAGRWEFPGGKLQPGEAPEAAVVRECREECGIDIRVDAILDVTFHSYEDRDVLLLFYRCTLTGGEVQHLEVADHAWASPSQLGDYDLPAADVRVIEKLQH